METKDVLTEVANRIIKAYEEGYRHGYEDGMTDHMLQKNTASGQTKNRGRSE